MTEPDRGIAAFERGAEQGWYRGFLVTAFDVMRSPTRTFSEMDRGGSLLLPAVFALLVTALPEVPTSLVELVKPGILGWLGPGLEGDMAHRLLGLGDYWLKLGGLSLLELLSTAPLLWVTLKITRQRCPPVRTIFRVACYTAAPSLLVPGVLTSAVIGLWGLFLFCVGIKQVGGPRPVAVFGALFVGQLGGFALAVAIISLVNALR